MEPTCITFHSRPLFCLILVVVVLIELHMIGTHCYCFLCSSYLMIRISFDGGSSPSERRIVFKMEYYDTVSLRSGTLKLIVTPRLAAVNNRVIFRYRHIERPLMGYYHTVFSKLISRNPPPLRLSHPA